MKGEYKRPTGLLGRAVFFTFALAFVFGLLLTTAATASWRYEVVEPAGRTSDDVSLALDTQGGPCIAYTDDSETGGTMNLRYVSGTYTGGSWDWRRETVDAHGLYDFFPSLAVDGDDNPHITYQWCGVHSNGQSKYAGWNGSSWVTHVLDGAYTGVWPAIALTQDGRPVISYGAHVPPYTVRCTAWNGSSWDWYPSPGQGWTDSRALVLDENDAPRVSFGQHYSVQYASWNGSGWDTETVSSGVEIAYTRPLVLDGSGRPHLLYAEEVIDDLTATLMYAKRGDSNWETIPIETVPMWGGQNKWGMALDSAGRPCVAFVDYPTYDLKYAVWDDGTWSVETVDDERISWVSFVLDSNNNPWIGYVDADHGNRLTLAYIPEPATLSLLALAGLALLRRRR